MKVIFLISLVVFSVTLVKSQDMNLGLKGGLNFSKVGGDDARNVAKFKSGFHAGVYFSIVLTENIALQPELLYTTKGFENNIFDNTQIDISIAKADRVTGLLYSQNRLVISYFVLENQETSYYVTVLNTVDNSIVKTLQFDATVQFITTDNTDNLVLGYPGSSSTTELKVYTLNTMELLGEYSSDTFFIGVNDGLLRDNNLFYLQGFPQPSAINFLPSIFNIETNTSNSINILPAIETYAQNNDIANISVINGVFDVNNNTVLVSANITTATDNSTTNKAGIFLFDFNGNMLSNILIEEDFSPFYIFLK